MLYVYVRVRVCVCTGRIICWWHSTLCRQVSSFACVLCVWAYGSGPPLALHTPHFCSQDDISPLAHVSLTHFAFESERDPVVQVFASCTAIH